MSDASPSTPEGPLLTTNSKAKRLESEKRTRWFVSSDEPRDHQTSSLKALWGPLLRSDAADILFPVRVGSMVSAWPSAGLCVASCRHVVVFPPFRRCSLDTQPTVPVAQRVQLAYKGELLISVGVYPVSAFWLNGRILVNAKSKMLSITLLCVCIPQGPPQQFFWVQVLTPHVKQPSLVAALLHCSARRSVALLEWNFFPVLSAINASSSWTT